MRWRTTQDIFKDLTEYFDPNWMNYDTIQAPPNPKWDYSRPLQIEDVDIWEVIFEQGGKAGVYAAWCPYAEFYMIRVGWRAEEAGWGVETYYGPGSQEKVLKRSRELGFPIFVNKIWVNDEDMWLYQKPEPKNGKLILP